MGLILIFLLSIRGPLGVSTTGSGNSIGRKANSIGSGSSSTEVSCPPFSPLPISISVSPSLFLLWFCPLFLFFSLSLLCPTKIGLLYKTLDGALSWIV